MADRKNSPNFESLLQSEVPNGRHGKHRSIITKILSDLAQLQDGRAVKVPLVSLNDLKENVRSALNRESHKRGINVCTASDDMFLYVWQESGAKKTAA